MVTGTLRWWRSAPVLAAALALIAAAAADPARAAIPSKAIVANPVLTQPGGADVGLLAFDTQFTDTQATGTATATLRLAAGRTYRMITCVWDKAPGAAPISTCDSADVRPTALNAIAGVPAPTARLTVERPAAGAPAATIAGTVLVFAQQADGSFPAYASSWPAAGLPAAGIAIPPTDRVTASVLGPQGVARPGVYPGGINSGAQDSICRENVLPGSLAPEGSTTALGAQPFGYDVADPPPGVPLRGTMLIVHGGAWSIVGPLALGSTRADAQRWRTRGWRTVNVDYRACAASLGDVLAIYDRVRATYGSRQPICAFGRSAGGHLTLLLAARRPALDCVAVIASPTDLPALAHETTAADPDGPPMAYDLATAAFGEDRLAQLSPIRTQLRARVLFALADNDALIPLSQGTAFAARQRRRDPSAYVDVLRVPAGDVQFEHGYVSPAGELSYFAHEDKLVAPLLIGGVSGPARAQLRVVRARGLRASFRCSRACTVSARLQISSAAAHRAGLARIVGRGTARRRTAGTGRLTIRLTSAARRRLRAGAAQLVSTVTAGSTHRRQTADVTLRRP
jgi:acetyl esterase/lipase